MIKNFRTFNQAVEFYHLATALKIRGPLKNQLERAAASIPLNLAEGSGKSTAPDKRRFYQIAFGSARECQSVLILLRLEGTQSWTTLDALAASLFCLIKATA